MRRFPVAMAVTALVIAAPGCRVIVEGVDTYDECFTTTDCRRADDRCVALSTGDALCTQTCSDDRDCPGAGRCLSPDGGASNLCFETCATSTFCEPGWTCQDVVGGGSNVCLPNDMPPPPPPRQPTYDECFATTDCESAVDSCLALSTGDAFCTRACSGDADCPGGGRCLSPDGGASLLCFETCTTSTVCEPGWSCQGVVGGSGSVCLPGGAPPPGEPTYDRCAVTADCDSTLDSCVAVTNDGLTQSQCTRTCTSDLDCPGSGHCVSFDGATSYCYETCITSSVCEIDWGCTDLSDGAAICLPGDGTPPPVGIPPYNECTPGTTPDPCSTLTDGCYGITVDGVTAGICTSGCSSAATCPATPSGLAGQCLAFSGSPAICFEGCIDSGDCLTGFACKSSLADGTTFPPICLPS